MGEMLLMTGPVGSGKSRRVLERMRAEGGARLLMVPDQYASEAERLLLEALGGAGLGFGGADVITPGWLRRKALDSSVLIGEPGRRMALRAALDAAANEMTVLPARSFGMTELVSGFLAQARRADLDAGSLAAMAVSAGIPQERFLDLAYVEREYRLRLDGRYWDDEDADRRVIASLEGMEELSKAQVWVDRFDSFPPRTARLIASMARVAARVTVVLNLPHGPLEGPYEAISPSLDALARAAREAGVALSWDKPMRPEEADPRVPELRFLTDHLFMPGRETFAGGEGLSLLAAATPSAEAQAAADAIAEMIESDPAARLRDIAVIVTDMETYAPLLERAFERRGIARFIDRRRPALAHPAVRALLAALEAVATGMRTEPMLSLLRSGYSGLEGDEAALLMRVAVELGLEGRRWHTPLRGRWAQSEPARAAVVRRLAALREGLEAARRDKISGGAAAALFDHLERAGAYPRLTADIARLNAMGAHVDALETAQIWNLLMDALDQLHALQTEGPNPEIGWDISASGLLRVLEAGLAAASVAVTPPSLDAVLVSTPDRVKTPPLRAVFLLGANAGLLLSPAQAGLLSDEECAALAGAGARFLTARENDALARLRLISVLAAASQRVRVSWALADEAGEGLRPAPVIAAIRRLFPGLADEFRPAEPPPPVPALAESPLAPFAAPAVIGVTALEDYAACPWRFFFSQVLRPHRPREPYPDAPDTGTALHAAAERWLAGLVDAGADFAALTREEHRAAVDAALDAVFAEDIARPDRDGGRMALWRAGARQTAEAALWTAARQIAEGAFRPVRLEGSFERALIPGVTLRGKLDRVDRAGAYLRVIDYKSGSSVPCLGKVWYGLSLQLPLYMKAARDTAGLPGTARVAGAYHLPLRDELLASENKSPETVCRLEGWTLDLPDVLALFDPQGRDGVVPTSKGRRRASAPLVPDPQIMDAIAEHAEERARRLALRIREGRFAPAPRCYGKENAPCVYCSARDACAFSARDAVALKALANDEVIERLKDLGGVE